MDNVINFNDYVLNITEEDVFNFFMIYKVMNENYFNVDLEILMKSLGKYKDMNKFKDIYKNLTIKYDFENTPYVDLTNTFEKFKNEKKILEYPSQKNIFFIIMKEDDVLSLKDKYDEHTLYLFDLLMFYVLQDLEFGLDEWKLVDEVEYIKLPNYPGVVTGQFIGKKKTKNVLKKVKEIAKENLRNLNN